MTPLELKTEIETGPLAAELAPFIAARNDGKISDILNRRDRPGKRRALLADLVNYLSDQGVLADIADAAVDATNTKHAPARKVVATLRLSTELGVTSINMTRPSNQTLISNLVTAGLMTNGQANGVKALADVMLSRADEVSSVITHLDVAQALRG